MPRHLRPLVAVVVGVVALGLGALALALPKVATEVGGESFDNEEAARAEGWVSVRGELGGNALGWLDGNATGRTPGGEAGGVMAAADEPALYIDTSIRGTVDLDQRIAASGELVVPGRGGDVAELAHVGTSLSRILPRVGWTIGGGEGNPELRAVIVFDDGVRLEADQSIALDPDQEYRFLSVWEPAAGDNGVLEVSVANGDDSPVGSSRLELTATQRARGATLDAFGLVSGATGGTVSTVIAVDALVYSVGQGLVPTT